MKKIAIHVKNKEQWNILMDHYKEIGYKPHREYLKVDGQPCYLFDTSYPFLQYDNNWLTYNHRIINKQGSLGFDVVSFELFCKIKGLDVPEIPFAKTSDLKVLMYQDRADIGKSDTVLASLTPAQIREIYGAYLNEGLIAPIVGTPVSYKDYNNDMNGAIIK